MVDIAMCCCCKDCERKSTCYRARADAKFFYQKWFDFHKFCEERNYKYYIEMKENKVLAHT